MTMDMTYITWIHNIMIHNIELIHNNVSILGVFVLCVSGQYLIVYDQHLILCNIDTWQ